MKIFTKLSSALVGCMMLSTGLFAQTATKESVLGTEVAGVTRKSNCFIGGVILEQQNVKCYGGSTGLAVIIVSAIGSTGPYTYTWSPAATAFADDSVDAAGNLAAGTYTVSVSNAAGCTGTVNVTITQPAKLTATNTKVIDDKCFGGNNGKAIISASGGTPFKNNPNYTYGWNPNVSKADSASNLTAGTYIVTITDSNKCTAKDTVLITQPAKINTVTNVVPSSCKTTNGSVGVTASNGVGAYTYSWSPGGNTTDSITGLGAGTYTCTVTDANGCSVTASAAVTDSTTLAATTRTDTNEKCNGNAIGSAAIKVTGGSGTVTYNWSPMGGTDTTAGNLPAGTYTFVATDAVGCQAIDIVTITQPASVRDSMTGIREIACYGGSTGRVTAGVKGGTKPYNYVWSTGGTSATVTNIPAGPVTVYITDANGCKDTATVTLTQPATAVADSNIITNVTCYGTATGSATIYAYGGTPYKIAPNYSYAWSTTNSNTTSSVTGLAAGTYVVRIRDTNRCTLHDTITINQPAPYIIANDTLLSADSGCGNIAWVQVVGTVSKYSFAWSPTGGSHDTATGLCPNTSYVVTVMDSTGCSLNDTITIINPTGIQQITNTESIKVYPVPATNQINIGINSIGFIPQNVTVYDITGRDVLNKNISANTSLLTLDVSKLNEGTYFLKLTGITKTKLVKFSIAGR